MVKSFESFNTKLNKMPHKEDKPLHIAMYPWFAMGHLTSYLHLANKLADRGHIVSLLLPAKTRHKLASLNHHPSLITFIPKIVPPVDGLPPGAETTNDVDGSARPKIMEAMDLTQDKIDSCLSQIKPDFVFFDKPEWLPRLAREHGAKPVYYATPYASIFAYCNLSARSLPSNHRLTKGDLVEPPPGFPSSSIRLHTHEAHALVGVLMSDFGNGMSFLERQNLAIEESDAIGFKTCREMEGVYCNFLEKRLGKPVMLAGFVVPESPSCGLDDYFDSWLKGFSHGSVVYCALGSECFLHKDQFHELVLGLELTGRPFLAALKPPIGYETIESALPKGFTERTKGRGVVYGAWVQQQLILQHPSVGCFVTHCGSGSLSEALMSDCQLMLMPQAIDQFVNARILSSELRVGVEVEKREHDGFVTRQAIQKAVELVMGEGSEAGFEVKANHAKWRNLLSRKGLEESYIENFIENLQKLLK